MIAAGRQDLAAATDAEQLARRDRWPDLEIGLQVARRPASAAPPAMAGSTARADWMASLLNVGDVQQVIAAAIDGMTVTLALIFLLLYAHFRSAAETMLVMLSLPFALVGGLCLVWALGYNWSVAVAIGFIALAGVAAETGG